MNKEIFKTLSYGLYAIGVKGENYPSMSIVNTVFQVANNPTTIAVSINHNNYTNKMIKENKKFTVSVLSQDTSGTVIGALGFSSGADSNKLKNLDYKVLREGTPVLKEKICCWFLCDVIDSIETKTHTIFIATVSSGSEEYKRIPMTYNYYRNVIKGKAPSTAPTYQEEVVDNDQPSEIYICNICGYEYKNKTIPFTELPEDWICPICKAKKEAFALK